jgi:hypothetical protein
MWRAMSVLRSRAVAVQLLVLLSHVQMSSTTWRRFNVVADRPSPRLTSSMVAVAGDSRRRGRRWLRGRRLHARRRRHISKALRVLRPTAVAASPMTRAAAADARSRRGVVATSTGADSCLASAAVSARA